MPVAPSAGGDRGASGPSQSGPGPGPRVADPTRCPRCGAALGGPGCGACGLLLTGPPAQQLWQASVELDRVLTSTAALQAERHRLDAEQHRLEERLRGLEVERVRLTGDRQRVEQDLDGLTARTDELAGVRTRLIEELGRTSPSPVAGAAGAPGAGWTPPPGQAPPGQVPPGQVPLGQVPPPPSWTRPGAPVPPPPGAGTPVPPAAPRPGLGVQTLLVGLGALLLAVAAVVFLFFSWGALGVTGRSVVVAVGTVAVLTGSAVARRVRLVATAEAVGAFGVVLVLLDVWAVRRTGLAGADLSAAGYAAAGLAVATVVLALWGRAARVRAGTLAAAGLLPLVPLLATLDVVDRLERPADRLTALVVGLLVSSLVTLVRVLPPARPLGTERALLAAAGALALLSAGTVALVTRVDGAGLPVLLLLATAVAATAHGALSTGLERSGWSGTAGVAAALAAATATTVLPTAWWLVLAPAAAGLVAVALRLARTARPESGLAPPVLAAARSALWTALVVGVPAAGVWLLHVMVVPAAALYPWSQSALSSTGAVIGEALRDADAGVPAGTAIAAPLVLAALGTAWRRSGGAGWSLVVGVLMLPAAAVAAVLHPALALVTSVAGLLLVAVGCVLAAVRRTGGAQPGRPEQEALLAAGALSGTGAVLLAWTVEPLSVPVTLAGVAALLLARKRWAVLGLACVTTSGLALLVSVAAVAVSAGADPVAAATAGALAAALLAVAAAVVPDGTLRPPLRRPERQALLLVSLVAVPAALLVVFVGDGRTAVPLTALTLAVLLVAADPRARLGRLERLVAAAGAVPLAALTAAVWVLELVGPGPDGTGGQSWSRADGLAAVTAATVVAVGLVAVAALARAGAPLRRPAEGGAAGAGLVVLVTAAALGPEPLWVVLTLLAAGVGATALLPDRRPAGWLALALGTGALWVRLSLADVGTVEAWTLPPALVLLTVAAVRRVRDERDPVLSGGAALAVLPTVVAAVSGPAWRAVLVGALAAVLVALAVAADRRGLRVVRLSAGLALAAGLVGVWLHGVLAAGADAGWRAWLPELWTVPAAALVAVALAVLARALASTPSVAAPSGTASSGTAVPTPATIAWVAGLLLAAVPTLVAAAVDREPVARTSAVLLAGVAAALLPALRGARPWPPVPAAATGLGLATVAVLIGLPVVSPPEVQLAVLALAVLALGVLHLRRAPAARTWPSLGPGLALLLLPSLWLATTDPQAWRVVAVAVLSAGAVAVGAARRWQAPLLLGSLVLAVHAVVQLWPLLVGLYDALPRWVALGLAGALLLALGVRYERRVRDLRSLQTRVAAMR